MPETTAHLLNINSKSWVRGQYLLEQYHRSWTEMLHDFGVKVNRNAITRNLAWELANQHHVKCDAATPTVSSLGVRIARAVVWIDFWRVVLGGADKSSRHGIPHLLTQS